MRIRIEHPYCEICIEDRGWDIRIVGSQRGTRNENLICKMSCVPDWECQYAIGFVPKCNLEHGLQGVWVDELGRKGAWSGTPVIRIVEPVLRMGEEVSALGIS